MSGTKAPRDRPTPRPRYESDNKPRYRKSAHVLSVKVDAATFEAVTLAAEQAGQSVSGWCAEAVRMRLVISP